MIRAGYLSPEDRADLIALARDGSAAHRLARRANALVLLDDGWSCEQVAAVLRSHPVAEFLGMELDAFTVD